VNPHTGLVTASDQEGNYVPATPLYLLRQREFHGFLSVLQPREKYPAPIADPLLWIPHLVDSSAASQVWLTDAKMGPLTGALIHLGYNRPEIFHVMIDDSGDQPQGALVSVTHDLPFAALNGAVNPIDGQLYVTGFRIWGTVAKQVSGLARLRYTGAPDVLPRAVEPTTQGLLLRFDVALDGSATDPARYVVERWNYRRTAADGSPHYKLDGSVGQELMPIGGVYLSLDRKSVFIGVPDLRAGVMQMHLGWSLRTAAGQSFDHNAYFTPYGLRAFHPTQEGFAPLVVDLTPHHSPSNQASTAPSVAEGRRLYEFTGCMACHSVDGTKSFAPGWRSLSGSMVPLADGTRVLADRDYLKESILNPGAKITRGYEIGMPNYSGILTDTQIESLVLYIESLK
jgi:mono/diheme cytochrome c family protein